MQNFLPITNYPTNEGLAQDLVTPGPTQSPDVVRGDAEVAFSIQPVSENPAGSRSVYDPDFDDSDVLTMGIGNFDQAPTGGTVSLTANGNATSLTAIAYNQSAATLQTAFNAAITAGGGGSATALCTVTLIQAGVYLLIGSTNQAVATGFFTVTSAALLVPISTATFYEQTLGSASTPYRVLFVMAQSALCYAEATALLADPDASLSTVQVGAADANKIQNLSFTPGTYDASVTVSATANSVTATCGTITLGMTVAQVGAVLSTHPEIVYNATDGTANNISITPIGNGWNWEFIGTLGNDNANAFSIVVQDVNGPKGKSGTINYNTVELLLYSYTQTKDSFTLKRQIQRTRVSGEVRTIYLNDVTISKSILNAATAVPVPVASYYTTTQTNALLALKQSILRTYVAVTTTYSVLASDQVVNATSGTFTITLPTAASITGKPYAIKNSGSGVITLATTGGQTIDGAATQTLAQYDSLTVMSNGANWIIL